MIERKGMSMDIDIEKIYMYENFLKEKKKSARLYWIGKIAVLLCFFFFALIIGINLISKKNLEDKLIKEGTRVVAVKSTSGNNLSYKSWFGFYEYEKYEIEDNPGFYVYVSMFDERINERSVYAYYFNDMASAISVYSDVVWTVHISCWCIFFLVISCRLAFCIYKLIKIIKINVNIQEV